MIESFELLPESQALTTAANGGVVPDHLDTPRIIVDEIGSRANVKRHDYLPFGEELVVGGRTAAMG